MNIKYPALSFTMGLFLVAMLSWPAAVSAQTRDDSQNEQVMSVSAVNPAAGTITLDGRSYRMPVSSAQSDYRWEERQSTLIRDLTPGDTVLVIFDRAGGLHTVRKLTALTFD